jgi:hypothetical protein
MPTLEPLLDDISEDQSCKPAHPTAPHVQGRATQEIERCEWNQLVLDQRAISLLTDEFESFLPERKLVLVRSGYHSAGISLARAARKPKDNRHPSDDAAVASLPISCGYSIAGGMMVVSTFCLRTWIAHRYAFLSNSNQVFDNLFGDDCRSAFSRSMRFTEHRDPSRGRRVST